MDMDLIKQPVAEPNLVEDVDNVLVLVQGLVQVQEQKQVQVEVQQRPPFLDIDWVKLHTAVPNTEVNYCKLELAVEEWLEA